MIIARGALCFGDGFVVWGVAQHHALRKWRYQFTEILLPGGLVLWILKATFGLKLGLPLAEGFIRHQHVCTAIVQVNPDDIACLQQGQPATRRCLRRGIEDGG